jgi:hypothetical protein
MVRCPGNAPEQREHRKMHEPSTPALLDSLRVPDWKGPSLRGKPRELGCVNQESDFPGDSKSSNLHHHRSSSLQGQGYANPHVPGRRNRYARHACGHRRVLALHLDGAESAIISVAWCREQVYQMGRHHVNRGRCDTPRFVEESPFAATLDTRHSEQEPDLIPSNDVRIPGTSYNGTKLREL